jgi:hypothetical protein
VGEAQGGGYTLLGWSGFLLSALPGPTGPAFAPSLPRGGAGRSVGLFCLEMKRPWGGRGLGMGLQLAGQGFVPLSPAWLHWPCIRSVLGERVPPLAVAQRRGGLVSGAFSLRG